MRLLIGSDHAGFDCKEAIKPFLAGLGHTVRDAGTSGHEACDYPDYALAVARAVAAGEADRGVLICGTGIGMSISANKVAGIRAAILADPLSTRLSRSHNDTNVACLGARVQRVEDMQSLLRLWLETPFEGGRHARRLDKIAAVEPKGC
jgi:ribose 5-phosphate isomerase B